MGQMGDNLPPVALGTGRSAVALAAGAFHTCALLDDATVNCWGRNIDGQLGLGDTKNRGDLPNQMGNALPAVSLGTGRTALGVAAGESHSCALLDNATLECWGRGTEGQLGLGGTLTLGDGAGEMGDSLLTLQLP